MITGYKWELYDADTDFSQAENLAAKKPEKLLEMQLLFYTEAAKYNVLPLDNSKTVAARPGHPPEPDPRAEVVHVLRGADAASPKGPARTSRTSRGRSPPRWR